MANKFEPRIVVTEVIRDTPNLLNITGTSNIGLVMVSAVGPKLAYIQGPRQFLATYTTDGVIPRNADITFINAYYLSFSAGLVISRSMNTTTTQGVLFFEDGTSQKLLYKDELPLEKQLPIAVNITAPTKWSFVLNDTVFFLGNYSEVSVDPDYATYQKFYQCNVANDIASGINHWDGCYATYATTTLVITHENFITFTTNSAKNKGITITIPLTDEDVQDDVELILKPQDEWLYSCYATTPQASDIYKIGMDEISGDSTNFNLRLTYPDPITGENKTDSYTSSLFTEAVDVNGASSYLENLNTTTIQFRFKVYSVDILPEATTADIVFGNSGLNLKESATPSNLTAALDSLEDQMVFDIEYLAPVGITNLQFIKRYTTIGAANKWFTPVDIPIDRTNANSIQQYLNNIDNNSNIYACGPFDKNSGLTGWINYLACSTLYYERVMNNKAGNAEFAPVFEEQYGTLNMVNPTKILGKSDREALLNFGSPSNYALYNERTQLYYMNNNLTHQSVDNIVSEEQNRRLVNKINKDLKRLLRQFLGRYNTNSTRSDVVAQITLYFKNNIMTIKFPPDGYQIICNTDNNTPELIRANKLAITVKTRLYNSIKDIDVLNEIFPLGVAFDQ